MQVVLTGRGMEIDQNLKEYIDKKVQKLAKYGNKIYHASVIIENIKQDYCAEILLHLKNKQVVAKEHSIDAHAAFDIAMDTMKVRLRRRSDKIKMRKRRILMKNISNPVGMIFGDRLEEISSIKIVRTDDYLKKALTAKEASTELDQLPQDFIMFKNKDTDESNVLYKRKDGTHGLIEPQL